MKILLPLNSKVIPGFDGFYAVDTEGQIWTCRVTGPCVDRKGHWKKKTGNGFTHDYPVVHLTLNRKNKEHRVHTLVLTTFRGPKPPGMEGCHEDDNKTNNRLSNLRWGTHQSNVSDGKRNRRYRKGEKNPSAKLTYAQIKEIRKLYSMKKFNRAQLATTFKVSWPTMDSIVKDKKWRVK